jgi:hypothetical protein
LDSWTDGGELSETQNDDDDDDDDDDVKTSGGRHCSSPAREYEGRVRAHVVFFVVLIRV